MMRNLASPETAESMIAALKDNDIPSWDIGEITANERVLIDNEGHRGELIPVTVDPFWAAYFSTLED